MEKQTASRTSPNICHVNAPKKEKACGGVSYRALLGKYTGWALMKKRQSREKKGFALRRDQNNGEKTGCLPRPNLFSRCPTVVNKDEAKAIEWYEKAADPNQTADRTGSSRLFQRGNIIRNTTVYWEASDFSFGEFESRSPNLSNGDYRKLMTLIKFSIGNRKR